MRQAKSSPKDERRTGVGGVGRFANAFILPNL
jgi:hypothetical protein